jgi:CHAD domain-containing protein
MKPLTFDDLVPLHEYVARRPEIVAAHARYRDQSRRVRIGPKLTLYFENRRTLLHHVQEIIRVGRVTSSDVIRQILQWYNPLLPRPEHLQAAMVFDQVAGSRKADVVRVQPAAVADAMRLVVDAAECSAILVTDRAADRMVGDTLWVEFPISNSLHRALADFHRPARFVVQHTEYQYESAPLSDDVRRSWLEDLSSTIRRVA